jgi:hypothetical protein
LGSKIDIWAVDYMPIQIDHNEFVQFIYRPDYLQGKIWRNSISDGAQIAHTLGIKSRTSDIICQQKSLEILDETAGKSRANI